MNVHLSGGPRPEPGTAGFTLLEVLVSLVLMSLLLTALPHALRMSQRAFRVGSDLDHASARAAEMGFVERRLSEAMPLYQHTPDGLLAITFHGEPSALRFVAPMTGPSDQNGLYLFSLAPVSDDDGAQKLTLTWQPFRSNADQLNPPKVQGKRILMSSAEDFSIAYFGASSPGQAPQWTESWTRRDALPSAVELSYRDPSGQRQMKKRRVELHLQSQQ